MKKTREELISEINEAEISDEIKVQLMEDITDSFEEVSTDGEDFKAKYEELMTKYKERFLQPVDKKEKEPEEVETEEKNIVDIKEI